MCSSSLLSLIPRSCFLLFSPTELLWFLGGAMFFLTSRSHPSNTSSVSDILATPPGPTVQPALIHNLCISLLVLAPSLGETALLNAAIAPLPCSLINACVSNSIFGHTVSTQGKEHVISCTAASEQLPVRTYYCTYVWNKLSIQSNSI